MFFHLLIVLFFTFVSSHKFPCIGCCTSKRTFLQIGDETVTSAHVLFRPFKYYVPPSKLIQFPEHISVCDPGKYPKKFISDVKGKIVMIRMNSLNRVCFIEQWTKYMQEYHAMAVLVWMRKGSNKKLGCGGACNDKKLKIPTRALEFNVGLEFKIKLKISKNFKMRFGCYTDASPRSICLKDIGDGKSWEIDGNYQRQFIGSANGHPFWKKIGYSNLIQPRYLWLHVDRINGWFWVVSNKIGGIADTFPNNKLHNVDAYCHASSSKNDDPTKCKQWYSYNFENVFGKKYLKWVKSHGIKFFSNINCELGKNQTCITSNEKKSKNIAGTFVQVHKNVPNWIRLDDNKINKNYGLVLLAWGRFRFRKHLWWGWKIHRVPQYNIHTVCPYIHSGLYGWYSSKQTNKFSLNPWSCPKWFSKDKFHKYIEDTSFDVDRSSCAKNKKPNLKVPFPKSFCFKSKRKYHLFQKYFGTWVQIGMIVNQRPVYGLERSKLHMYMVYNLKADSWVIVNKLPQKNKLIKPLFECNDVYAATPFDCKSGWRHGIYLMNDIIVSKQSKECFVDKPKTSLQMIKDVKTFCIYLPNDRLPKYLKWRTLNPRDASGIYHREKDEKSVKKVYYKRRGKFHEYLFHYDHILRYWVLKFIHKKTKRYLYCPQYDAPNPFLCNEWYTEDLHKYGHIFNITTSVEKSHCVSKFCVDTKSKSKFTSHQYLYGEWKILDNVETNSPIYYNIRLSNIGKYPVYFVYLFHKWYIIHELDRYLHHKKDIVKNGFFYGYCDVNETVLLPYDCPKGQWVIHGEKDSNFELYSLSTLKKKQNCFKSELKTFPGKYTLPGRICIKSQSNIRIKNTSRGLFSKNVWKTDLNLKFGGRNYWYKYVCAGDHKKMHHHHHHKHHHRQTHPNVYRKHHKQPNSKSHTKHSLHKRRLSHHKHHHHKHHNHKHHHKQHHNHPHHKHTHHTHHHTHHHQKHPHHKHHTHHHHKHPHHKHHHTHHHHKRPHHKHTHHHTHHHHKHPHHKHHTHHTHHHHKHPHHKHHTHHHKHHHTHHKHPHHKNNHHTHHHKHHHKHPNHKHHHKHPNHKHHNTHHHHKPQHKHQHQHHHKHSHNHPHHKHHTHHHTHHYHNHPPKHLSHYHNRQKHNHRRCLKYFMYYNEARRYWVVDTFMTSLFVHPSLYCPNHNAISPHLCKHWYNSEDKLTDIKTYKAHHQTCDVPKREKELNQNKETKLRLLVIIIGVIFLIVMCGLFFCVHNCTKKDELAQNVQNLKPKTKEYVQTDNEIPDDEKNAVKV